MVCSENRFHPSDFNGFCHNGIINNDLRFFWPVSYGKSGLSGRGRVFVLTPLPVPNEMPGPDANECLFESHELIAESVKAGGGLLRGWKRAASDLAGE